ncbi:MULTISPECIES: hypothetical protein [Acinetobacter]|uniref:hypothetical protein n=1 Tax=Acinetobacter TaxID=469 RepID=UPI0014481CA2|nr:MULTISPECIES: hypothetical protein [Acinetobacter]MEB6564537.1 hypothetical protein [Acinetobacter towneri]
MQDNAMSRWLSPLMAFGLSFIIIATLAPMTGIQVERQLDFWLLWLGTMVILALPITYLEIALAKRSKSTALQALSGLTRDADASPKWRIVGWLAVVFIPFLAGGLLSNAAQILNQYAVEGLASNIVLVILAVVALALSLLARQILLLCTAVAVVAALVLANVFGTQLPAWQVTPIELGEWGSATVLALVASGLGMGLYWQTSLAQAQQQNAATSTVLPIWIAQLLAVVAFAFFAVQAQIPALALVVAAVAAAAVLLQLAREQLAQRQMAVAIQWIVLIAATLVWAVPAITSVFNFVLLLWGLVICLIYAIFAGWIMKISHLRKAMNFSSEALYNLWRIAVRVVLPISIVVAIFALIGQFLA